jgi:hypothetical protein
MVMKFINWIKSLFAPSKSEGVQAPLTKTPINVSEKKYTSKRNIRKIIVHCTASNIYIHGQRMRFFLHKWHVLENKWKDIGYHFGIDGNAARLEFRDIDIDGAHCRDGGMNRDTIGVVIHGKSKFDFGNGQMSEFVSLIDDLCDSFDLTYDDVEPHNKYSDKACPNFDIKTVLGVK